MAQIRSGVTTDLWTIDPASNAGRMTLYDTNGNPWATVPISGAVQALFATPLAVSGTVSIEGPAAVSGTVSVGNSPAVSQTAGPWAVSGTVSTVGSLFTVSTPLAVSGSLTVSSGAIAVTNLVQVSGAISASNVVQVSGSLQFNLTTSGQVTDVYFGYANTIVTGVSGSIMSGTTPAAGKRFRFKGFTFGIDQAAKRNLTFHDGCGAGGGTVIAYATVGASTSTPTTVDWGTGILLSTNNSVYIACDSSTSIIGTLWGHFE